MNFIVFIVFILSTFSILQKHIQWLNGIKHKVIFLRLDLTFITEFLTIYLYW